MIAIDLVGSAVGSKSDERQCCVLFEDFLTRLLNFYQRRKPSRHCVIDTHIGVWYYNYLAPVT